MVAAMDEHGYVSMASVSNLARRANVSLSEAEEAVKTLESPDRIQPEQDHDGRRIERVEGGWMVLNSEKYRSMVTRAEALQKNRERVARFRAKKCNAPVMPSNVSVMQSDQSISEAEAIYDAYPRKLGKKEALKAINVSLKVKPKETLLEATRAYAEAVKGWPASDHQFIPYPATWFNQGHYDDDRTEWQRKVQQSAGRAGWL